MPPDPDKRKLRELKREIKRRGGKARRRAAKQTLADAPDEAAHTPDTLGGHTSAWLNGLDRKDSSPPRAREGAEEDRGTSPDRS